MIDVAWVPGGERFLFRQVAHGAAQNRDIWWSTVDGTPQPFVATEFNERAARPSPDGRWVAYVSDSTGEDRIYLQPFPQGGPPVPVSPEAGREPLWSSNGREL